MKSVLIAKAMVLLALATPTASYAVDLATAPDFIGMATPFDSIVPAESSKQDFSLGLKYEAPLTLSELAVVPSIGGMKTENGDEADPVLGFDLMTEYLKAFDSNQTGGALGMGAANPFDNKWNADVSAPAPAQELAKIEDRDPAKRMTGTPSRAPAAVRAESVSAGGLNSSSAR